MGEGLPQQRSERSAVSLPSVWLKREANGAQGGGHATHMGRPADGARTPDLPTRRAVPGASEIGRELW